MIKVMYQHVLPLSFLQNAPLHLLSSLLSYFLGLYSVCGLNFDSAHFRWMSRWSPRVIYCVIALPRCSLIRVVVYKDRFSFLMPVCWNEMPLTISGSCYWMLSFQCKYKSVISLLFHNNIRQFDSYCLCIAVMCCINQNQTLHLGHEQMFCWCWVLLLQERYIHFHFPSFTDSFCLTPCVIRRDLKKYLPRYVSIGHERQWGWT